MQNVVRAAAADGAMQALADERMKHHALHAHMETLPYLFPVPTGRHKSQEYDQTLRIQAACCLLLHMRALLVHRARALPPVEAYILNSVPKESIGTVISTPYLWQ